MARLTLALPKAVYAAILAHLLPQDARDEEAAFLFVREVTKARTITLEYMEWRPVERAGFEYQSSGYLELAESMLGELIKRAHDLGACLVELHSHPYPWPAGFSPTDLGGLAEFVPHVRWRLKGRPYVAVVVAPSSFDALTWSGPSNAPGPLEGIRLGRKLLRPTGLTLGRNHDVKEKAYV